LGRHVQGLPGRLQPLQVRPARAGHSPRPQPPGRGRARRPARSPDFKNPNATWQGMYRYRSALFARRHAGQRPPRPQAGAARPPGRTPPSPPSPTGALAPRPDCRPRSRRTAPPVPSVHRAASARPAPSRCRRASGTTRALLAHPRPSAVQAGRKRRKKLDQRRCEVHCQRKAQAQQARPRAPSHPAPIAIRSSSRNGSRR
jgi:hypothetical protein